MNRFKDIANVLLLPDFCCCRIPGRVTSAAFRSLAACVSHVVRVYVYVYLLFQISPPLASVDELTAAAFSGAWDNSLFEISFLKAEASFRPLSSCLPPFRAACACFSVFGRRGASGGGMLSANGCCPSCGSFRLCL